jgi:DNA-binding CsgD family transcriptional regulator
MGPKKKVPSHEKLRPGESTDPLAKIVLNALSAHIAILDDRGFIIETNRAWQDFALRGGIGKDFSFIGQNYLDVCDASTVEHAKDAHAAAAGIRSVMRGDTEEFLHDYPCHTPYSRHWFYMRVIRMEKASCLRIIISHEEITALKLTEEALLKSKQTLEEQKQNLEETNIALKVLLRQRDEDKRELEQKVLINIKDLVFPYVEKLKQAPLRARDKANLEIIETHLKEVISPLLHRISHLNILLTPQEMQVSALIKDGKASKEIAGILAVSETTIHFHRKNLRSKFGIKNKNTNLRSYLMSLS